MRKLFLTMALAIVLTAQMAVDAQQRRPVDSQHPLWLIHVDVWNKADPQKIIDLIPERIRPFVCMNLSLSCQYDTEKNVYKMPQNAVRTYKSWASVCQQNGMWFTCQPASGGHTHIQDDDLETFEYFFRHYPNFLGWNYAEQFWGFDESGDRSSSTQASRIELFSKLVPMSHKYGGFLTVSFCGNIWSHLLNPVAMMKRDENLYKACQQYPEAILWLYKYTTSSCFYNNESVTFSPFISGLAKSYGVRYDNCGWNGALEALFGKDNGMTYPIAAGFGTVMEQTCVNGGCVWDGPELIWTEDIQNLSNTTVNGYTRRNWGLFPGFENGWIDMFDKIIDGSMYIPTREEVVQKTKIAVINNISSGSDEDKYAATGSLYDGLYKQDDPFNTGDGQWMNNYCYFKKTGRYAAIPVCISLYDSLARTIPVQVNKSTIGSRWSTPTRKVNEFNKQYEETYTGDLYVSRFKNQLVTYTPYTYLNEKKTASAVIPLKYNTCDTLSLTWGKLSTGLVHEYTDHIDFYLNNYRTDTTVMVSDIITVSGANSEPSFTMNKRVQASATASGSYDTATKSYTLTVKHIGPVDVTVNCTGTATDRSTDFVHDSALEMPVQPGDFYGPVVIEAEDMDYKSIKSCVTDPYGWYPDVRGHAGNGFMDMGTSTAGSLRHTIKIRHAGDYNIAVRYTNTAKDGAIAVSVNGKKQSLKCPKTSYNEWKKATFATTLNEGDNTLIITNSYGLNMYVDNVTYTPADIPAEVYKVTIRQASHGVVAVSADSVAEGDTVVLAVTPDEGYTLSGWTVIHGDVTVGDDLTFIMPDDNVTLQPQFADMSRVYALDFTDVLTGNIPEGWKCVQENDEVHQYPNSYSLGARSFSGFGGYQGKALYWRNQYAEYGSQTTCPLTLEKGSYTLTFTMAAWKGTPKYKARILTSSNTAVKESQSYTAAPNAGGSTSANLTSAKTHTVDFDITAAGKYVIRFQNVSSTSSGLTEFLLLQCKVTKSSSTDIPQLQADEDRQPVEYYDLSGRRLTAPQRGINIVRTADGQTIKLYRRD